MRRNLPAILLIVLAIFLVVTGILLQQQESVLHKAVRICMECIGLG